eukprot:2600862-Amphidinium_carterae.1
MRTQTVTTCFKPQHQEVCKARLQDNDRSRKPACSRQLYRSWLLQSTHFGTLMTSCQSFLVKQFPQHEQWKGAGRALQELLKQQAAGEVNTSL